jgi:hypothetical protein
VREKLVEFLDGMSRDAGEDFFKAGEGIDFTRWQEAMKLRSTAAV